MTREEAVEVIKAFVAYGEHVKAFVYRGSTSIPIEALNMAIKALEKESPCDMCEYEEGDYWEMCQFCPAEPKGGDEE